MRRPLIALVAAAAVALSACGEDSAEPTGAASSATGAPSATTEESPSAQESASDEAAEPAALPQRIVAVSSETSDMALLLAGPERMAAISATSQAPQMGMVPELARQVTDTLPSGINPDAEQILSFNPDLVLTTARHGGEKDTSAQLAAAGVEMVEFPGADFDTPETYAAALQKVGEAVGEQEKAKEIADELLGEFERLDATRTEGEQPSVLALMARGGKVMAMDSGNALPALALRAGAKDAAGEAGITATGPLDAELLLKANPDIILVEDFMGAGEGPFQELLRNPALADVPAIKDGRIEVVPMTEASALAGVNMVKGYERILSIVQG